MVTLAVCVCSLFAVMVTAWLRSRSDNDKINRKTAEQQFKYFTLIHSILLTKIRVALNLVLYSDFYNHKLREQQQTNTFVLFVLIHLGHMLCSDRRISECFGLSDSSCVLSFAWNTLARYLLQALHSFSIFGNVVQINTPKCDSGMSVINIFSLSFSCLKFLFRIFQLSLKYSLKISVLGFQSCKNLHII